MKSSKENFKDLKIWQKGFDIAVNSYIITKEFPLEEKLGLAPLIRKGGIAIPSNIAEGSSRKNPREYNKFIEQSLGNVFELETQYLIARKMRFGNITLIDTTLDLLEEEEQMLTAFGRSLLTKSR